MGPVDPSRRASIGRLKRVGIAVVGFARERTEPAHGANATGRDKEPLVGVGDDGPLPRRHPPSARAYRSHAGPCRRRTSGHGQTDAAECRDPGCDDSDSHGLDFALHGVVLRTVQPLVGPIPVEDLQRQWIAAIVEQRERLTPHRSRRPAPWRKPDRDLPYRHGHGHLTHATPIGR